MTPRSSIWTPNLVSSRTKPRIALVYSTRRFRYPPSSTVDIMSPERSHGNLSDLLSVGTARFMYSLSQTLDLISPGRLFSPKSSYTSLDLISPERSHGILSFSSALETALYDAKIVEPSSQSLANISRELSLNLAGLFNPCRVSCSSNSLKD